MTPIHAPEGAESITEAELAAYYEQRGDVLDPKAAASAAFGVIGATREPEYEPGEIYEDDQGDAYHRLAPGPGNGQWTWTKCHTGLRVGDGVPVRPLRKLVPEGPQSAKPSHRLWREGAAVFRRLGNRVSGQLPRSGLRACC